MNLETATFIIGGKGRKMDLEQKMADALAGTLLFQLLVTTGTTAVSILAALIVRSILYCSPSSRLHRRLQKNQSQVSALEQRVLREERAKRRGHK